MNQARIPKFYKLSVAQRLREMQRRGLLSKEDYAALLKGDHVLNIDAADKMIENVVSVLGLPVGLGVNFLINDHDYVIPLAVEEPSIVAALSSAAKIAANSGGFTTTCEESYLIGQVQLVEITNHAKARAAIVQ